MTPRPWFGFLRGLRFALWPGRRQAASALAARSALPARPAQAAPWQEAATRRRAALLALVAGLTALAAAVQLDAAPARPEVSWWLYSALLVLLFTWVALGCVTAAMGAWVLWRGDRHALAAPAEDGLRRPIHRGARTAIVMPVCNEDIATVFGGLRATCESLAATGALALFDFYILSDTSDTALRAAELRAWQQLREMMGDGPVPADGGRPGGRIFYRWRQRRVKRKAGNVADFCRRWGRNYRYMVVLDADSTMHGDTLVALVRLMEREPRAGIVQTLPQPTGHGTLHARAQQFAHRVSGRLFSLGMAWWQLGDSHYWGHNAILRVAPFMQHCALAKLPGRGGLAGEILSHDFVEAALMSRAGYEVWLATSLAGSWEQNPPHLLDELQRDRRWCQGNLQNLRLVAEPGWRPVHRVLFGTAAFSYLAAPLWLAFIALGLAVALADATGRLGDLGSQVLWLLTLALLLLPRVLAVAAVWLQGEQGRYGGTARLIGSALAEAVLSALQAPLRMLAHSLFVMSALTGLELEWRSPARQAGAVSWRDAWARVGWLSWPALALVALAVWHGGHGSSGVFAGPLAWMWLLPLVLAVPLIVASARPDLGARLERWGLLWNPEARRPPRTLARAGETRAFAALAPRPSSPGSPAVAASAAARASKPSVAGPWSMRRPRAAFATAAVVFGALAISPRLGPAPELPPWLHDSQNDVLAMLAQSTSAAPMVLASAKAGVQHQRPARRIDEALRQRARAAVARAIELDRENGPMEALEAGEPSETI